MGRRCYICKKWDYRHPNLTFYSITKDIVLRRKWFDVMGVTETDLPQLKEVCSEHFTNDDFETTLSGKKRLKKNVVPTLYTKEEDRKQLKVCHYPLKEAFLSATGASQEAICGEPALRVIQAVECKSYVSYTLPNINPTVTVTTRRIYALLNK